MNKLITNNPLAAKRYHDFEIDFVQAPAREVLRCVRDLVHLGHVLLSHPLSSGVPPKDNPYKSVFISTAEGPLDMDSLRIIEGAVGAYKNSAANFDINPTAARDFMIIDCEMISQAARKLTGLSL